MSTSDYRSEEFQLSLTNGYRMAGKRWGPLENPTDRILALHGWLDNASTWDGVGPYFAKKNYLFVCLDFLGHGRSDHVPDEYTLLMHASSVYYAVETIGWTSFNLFAHSMGAAVATLVAFPLTPKVKSLVLVEGLGPWPNSRKAPQLFKDALQMRTKSFFDRKPKVYPNVQSAIDKLRENNTLLAKQSADVIVKRSLLKVQGGYSFSHDPKLVAQSFMAYHEQHVLQFIKNIAAPTLLIWTKATLNSYNSRDSSQEKKSMLDLFQERFDTIAPQYKNLLILEEGTHHVHLDNPELVSDHIFQFLEKNKTKAKL